MLDQYRRDCVEFHVAREHYLFHFGQKKVGIAATYERYSDLLDRDSIVRLKRELSNAAEHFGIEQASRRRLLAFAVEQFLEDSVKGLTEEISQYEAAATVEWMGRE